MCLLHAHRPNFSRIDTTFLSFGLQFASGSSAAPLARCDYPSATLRNGMFEGTDLNRLDIYTAKHSYLVSTRSENVFTVTWLIHDY